MKKLKKLGGLDISRHASNRYKERVTDDPIVKRGCTATDIERRIRSAVNKIEDFGKLPTLEDGTIVYRTNFISRGQEYCVLISPDKIPRRTVISIWTEELYQNYLNGIKSDGHNIYERQN